MGICTWVEDRAIGILKHVRVKGPNAPSLSNVGCSTERFRDSLPRTLKEDAEFENNQEEDGRVSYLVGRSYQRPHDTCV